MKFTFETTPDGDGFLVTCPELPEVTSDCDSLAEAPARARDAIEEAIAGRLEAFEDIPRPENGKLLSDPISTNLALKVMLFWRLHECSETRASLARKLDWKRNSVDRLFKPLHQTKNDQFDAAFAALNCAPEITITCPRDNQDARPDVTA